MDRAPALIDLATAAAERLAERNAHWLSHTEELGGSGAADYVIETGLVTQSAGMFRLFGEPASDQPVDGEWLMERVPPAEVGFVRAILEGVTPQTPCEFEHRILRCDGALRTVLHRSIAEAGTDGQPVRIISILQDITAQRAAEQQRDRLAQVDLVTGLVNRHALLEHLETSLARARRLERPLALLVLRVQQLTLVSDSLGMAGGDRLLAAVGDRIAARLMPNDTLAHLGSGLYALLPDRREATGAAEALAIGEHLADAFVLPFVIDGIDVEVTCAVGIASYPRDGDDADRLLHEAQAAMLRAAECGDNQVRLYRPDIHAKAARKLALQAGLRRALANGEFRLEYQPQLDLANGRVVGVEALIRWTDAAGQAVSPAEFIPLAEECGLILAIGDWVLRTACAQNAAWQRAGLPPVRVAVNLSMRQLQQPDIARRVQQVLLDTGLDPRWLGIELTEGVLMDESEHVAAMLQAMKALGIEISLDDFGTGYSNLSYLSRLPIDVVKIDRSYVHDVAASAHDVSMTRSVIAMAHSLHKKVLAEGVEHERQVALLIEHRCDQLQGYWFSRPLPASRIAALLFAGRGLPARLLRPALRQRCILVVEPMDALDDIAARMPDGDGYRVLVARSGSMALRVLAEEAVDVIVVDQRIAGMAAHDLLRGAQAACPDVPRLLLVHEPSAPGLPAALNDGAVTRCLASPCETGRLRARVVEAARQRAMTDDNRRLDAAATSAGRQAAEAARRVEQLLARRGDELRRHRTSLSLMQDLLAQVPAPLIGIDADGMIAYVNADAEALFAEGAAMLGLDADEALPPPLREIWRRRSGAYHDIEFGARMHRAVCTPLANGASGSLIVLAPGGTTA